MLTEFSITKGCRECVHHDIRHGRRPRECACCGPVHRPGAADSGCVDNVLLIQQHRRPVATKKKALKGARFGARKREAGALCLAYTPRRALSGDARVGRTGCAEAAQKRGRGAEAARKRGESRQRAQNREA
jgi:hypothetical protein